MYILPINTNQIVDNIFTVPSHWFNNIIHTLSLAELFHHVPWPGQVPELDFSFPNTTLPAAAAAVLLTPISLKP